MILVTGVAGFIGYHVAKELLEQSRELVLSYAGPDCRLSTLANFQPRP